MTRSLLLAAGVALAVLAAPARGVARERVSPFNTDPLPLGGKIALGGLVVGAAVGAIIEICNGDSPGGGAALFGIMGYVIGIAIENTSY